MKMDLANRLETSPYRMSAQDMWETWEKTRQVLDDLLSHTPIRFSGTDEGMEGELRWLKDKCLVKEHTAQEWVRMLELEETLEMVREDSSRFEDAMMMTGYVKRSIDVARCWWARDIPIIGQVSPRVVNLGSLHFYERNQGYMVSIISDRDWAKGTWEPTPYHLCRLDIKQVYEHISDAEFTFYSEYSRYSTNFVRAAAEIMVACLRPQKDDLQKMGCVMDPFKDRKSILEIIKPLHPNDDRYLWAA